MDLRAPPAHLSPSAAEWWKSTVQTYVLAEHHLRLLQLCCEAWDQCQAARAQLAREGMTVTRDNGIIQAHPCINIERNARIAVARFVRELDLDVGPPVSDLRPPSIFSNRGNHARKTASS